MHFHNRLILYIIRRPVFNWVIRKLFFIHWNRVAEKYAGLKDHSQKPRLCWGSTPLFSNRYWSNTLKNAGYDSVTLMSSFYASISKKEDFDLYFEDVVQKNYKNIPRFIKCMPPYTNYFIFDYILKNFDVLHTSCDGVTNSMSKETEVLLLKKFGIKTIVLPYGGDIHRYSTLINTSRKHAIQINYPEEAKCEEEIQTNINAWIKHCDIFIPSSGIDGIGRWDVLTCSILAMDVSGVAKKDKFNSYDGKNGEVVLVHAPNHRGAKGTDFVIHAVEELQKEGLRIKLKLIEKTSNDELLRIIREEADIVVNELIGSFYAMFCIEAMAIGIPIVSNLSIEEYTRVFRRFSYLNECPVVSGTAENAKEVLRILITDPELRKELGIAGRQFVEKYHSEKAAQFLFGKIYDKIWYNKEVDLMNLFHPLKKESYNNQSPKVQHPLVENVIPQSYHK